MNHLMSFLNKNNLNKKGKIFLSGRNSQHKNLVELIGKNLKMDVALISPINNNFLKNFHIILMKLINFLCQELLV